MRKVLLALVVVVIVAAGWFIIYTHPKHINKFFSGVEYRAGARNGAAKPVTVQVNGKLQRSIKGILTFQGTIRLEGNTQPNSDNNMPLTVHFDNPGGIGFMVYGFFTNGTPVTRAYGQIFINDNFSEVAILESKVGWTTTDGLTIAAPAFNRSQALSISNNLMKGWLNGLVVK